MGKVILTVLAAFVRFAAWFFAVATALWVSLISILCIVQPQGLHCIMAQSDDTTLTTSWGLTYQGWPGAIIAGAEVIVIVAALVASKTRKPAWRFIGHPVLVLWAGLWTVNAFRVLDDGTLGLIYILPVFLVCTACRAALDPVTCKAPVAAV